MDKATDRHLVLTTGFLLAAGGLEQALVNIALAARSHGYTVTVISRRPIEEARQYVQRLQDHQVLVLGPSQLVLSLFRGLLAVAEKLGLALFPMYWAIKRTGARQAWVRLRQELHFHLMNQPLQRVSDRWLWRSLTREHVRRPIGLLHGNRRDWAMPVVAHWAHAHGVPMICHEHSGIATSIPLREAPEPYTHEQATQLEGCTIAILSPLLAPRAARLFGPEAEIVSIGNWVEDPGIVAHPGQGEGVLTVGTASRIVEGKGLEMLVEATGRAMGRGTEMRGVIMGDGPLLAPLKQQAQKWQITSQVEFTGTLQAEEVKQRLALVDVFVLVSEAEGMPMSILEAMAMGLPILATPVGAVPDLVQEGVNGFLVPVGDVEALTERLCELASQPDLVQRMGQASRELYLANYTEEAAWPKLSALYDGLITKGRSTS